MLLPADPRKGKVRVAGWSFEKVPQGTSFKGHKAGECFGVYGHHMGAHKPCTLLYTNGKIPCAGCAKGRELQWLGYCPVWRFDGKAVVIGIKDYTLEVWDALALHAAVILGRNKGPSEPVWVLPDTAIRPYRATMQNRREAVQLAEWCLRLWGMEDFATYCRENKRVELVAERLAELVELPAGGAPVDQTPPEDDGVRMLRELQEAARAEVMSDPNAPLTEYIRSLPATQKIRERTAERNGVHAKPKPR